MGKHKQIGETIVDSPTTPYRMVMLDLRDEVKAPNVQKITFKDTPDKVRGGNSSINHHLADEAGQFPTDFMKKHQDDLLNAKIDLDRVLMFGTGGTYPPELKKDRVKLNFDGR